MTEEEKVVLVNFYKNLINHIFNKALRGDYRYERDMAQLRKYDRDATKANVQDQIHGRVLNAMGVISNLSGNFEQGHNYFLEAHAYHMEQGNTSQALTALTNAGFAERIAGDNASAEELFNKVWHSAEELGELVPVGLINNLVKFHYAMHHYDKIPALIDVLDANRAAYIEQDRFRYAASASNIYNFLTRIALRNKNMDEVYRLQAVTQDHIAGDSDNLLLAQVYMTNTYVAYITDDEKILQTNLRLAEQVINAANSPVLTARFYMEEAQEAFDFGMCATAIQFAENALQEFKQREMHQDTQRTQELLKTFNQTSG